MSHFKYISGFKPLALAISPLFMLSYIPAVSAESIDGDTLVLGEIVVTGTREERSKAEITESVATFDSVDIEYIAPSHPADLVNRSAGVHINNLSGEGHMTSIRQPITTKGVYLFLEDGIPTRPTGFFNHNGLYEVNVPQSNRVEVTKGPGSALYGSDAIGGIINSITKPSPEQAEASAQLEAGSYGWKRMLATVGDKVSEDTGFRADVNITDNSGYRQEADYSRFSSTLRVDSKLNAQWNSKTVMTYTEVDQSGTSSLESNDYYNNPKKNRYHGDIGYRDVNALRLSNEFVFEPSEDQQVSFIPYFRNNDTEMMPSWMITYDPNIRKTEFQSYGLMSKLRQNVWSGKGKLIMGMDVDYTPSNYEEKAITVTEEDDIYTDYTETGVSNYDYDADQLSISPYVHSEWQVHPKVRLDAGLRYDYFDVDYDDNLAGQGVDNRHLRPESQSVDFDEFSPKAGILFNFHPKHAAYFNYRHAFRAPSVGQLFRPGSSQETENLQPVTTDSFEVGIRGQLVGSHQYEVAVYTMTVKDDIVTYIDGSDRKTVNAGETSHDGIEVSLKGDITDEFSYAAAFTYTKQKYDDFQYLYQCFSAACGGFARETRNFEGFDVGKAPETIGNLTVSYYPTVLPKASFEAEWEHLGSYYTDETNTSEYGGHNLFNLRANYDHSDDVSFFARIMNLTDRRYSTYTSNQVGDPDISYRPGNPMTGTVGIKVSML